MQISTHTPAWGVTVYNMSYTSTEVNFNSHARVGRDAEDLAQFKVVGLISTHTPAWGVTSVNVSESFCNHISTHTPAWGVTLVQFGNVYLLNISTHTPAWGVTLDVVSKRHKIITRADYPMQNHTISHKIFLFYSFPLRSAPEFQIICGSQPE